MSAESKNTETWQSTEPSHHLLGEAEKVEIAVEGADPLYSEIRIGNSLKKRTEKPSSSEGARTQM